MKLPRYSRFRAFTLVEMMAVVAIIAILALMAIPSFERAARQRKENDLKSALTEIRNGIDQYKKASDAGQIPKLPKESGYPRSLDELVNGVDDMTQPGKKKFFMRRLPRDPMSADKESPPEKTWGLRSSQSPPEKPEPGEDVYDVYSTNTQKGSNGTPYNKW